MKEGGTVIVNTQRLIPPIALTKEWDYPMDAIEQIEAQGVEVIAVDVAEICQELGNPRLGSTVLLGTLSTKLSIPDSIWLEVIQRRVPKGTEEVNVSAFHRGKEISIEVQ